MAAIRIFLTTVQDIYANPLVALRITLPAIVAAVLSAVLMTSLFEAVIASAVPTGAVTAEGASNGYVSVAGRAAFIAGALGILFLALLGLSWSAVGWHRFVCLKEAPLLLFPHWHGRRVLRYVLRLAAMVLLLYAVLFLLLYIQHWTGPQVDTDAAGDFTVYLLSLPVPGTIRNMIVSLAIQTIWLAVVLWASLWLPACALDRPRPRTATPGAFIRTILPLSFLLCAVFLGLSLFVLLFPLGRLNEFLLIWLQYMAMVGGVTRLYLYFVPQGDEMPT